jgi:5-methylcytosine-specific restriction endonuclease McrA
MLRERDRNICQICKRVVGSRGASIDHIVPISHGGSHTWENVQLAHTKCNSSRGAGRLPAQMRLGGMASTRTPGPPTKRKLTEAIVRRIRYGGERAAALAAELGLGQRTVYDIRQSKTWAWLGVE